MRIAIFTWEALEGISVGGGAEYASRLAAALSRAGHQVRLFTRLGPGQATAEVVNGIHVRRCPWDRKEKFIDEIESLAQAFLHYYADSVRTEGAYDVLHCHEWFTIEAGLRAVEYSPARLAVSFHSTEWGRTGVWPDKGDSARISAWEGEGIRRADAVIAASYWVRRTIHEQFHPPDWKCEVVYHGCDLADISDDGQAVERIRQAAGLRPGEPSFLFAGLFSATGGADLAVAAARLAAAKHGGAKFLFVGGGPLEAEMRRQLGASGLFVPLRDRLVPMELYRAVDMVLAPFRRDHNGRAIFPAWAAARPVLALSGTVPSEFIMPGVNGWTVAADPVELAAAVIRAFDDPAHTAWMGRNGRAAAETAFSWDQAAGRLLAAYKRIDSLTPRSVRDSSRLDVTSG